MLKFLLTNLVFLIFTFTLSAQNFSGQWKGSFVDKSAQSMGWGGNRCEYVLDLECNGRKVSGYSYTYFSEGGRKFYTICRLEGVLDRKSKSIEIKEIERTKTNVPVNISNCFQIHKLTFFKQKGADETLEGKWIPAPNQASNCGYGQTILTRRLLANNYPGFRNTTARNNPRTNTSPRTATTDELKNIAKTEDKNKTAITSAKSLSEKENVEKTETAVIAPVKEAPLKTEDPPADHLLKTIPPVITTSVPHYEKRNNTVLKTIEIESPSIKIDLYDNGEVDGDSVSLFLNGKLLMAHKKLTTYPITIRFPQEELEDENELVMYADNLGTIPPNTALMVVTDGMKRYEVRITSDLQRSGTIRFVKKKKP